MACSSSASSAQLRRIWPRPPPRCVASSANRAHETRGARVVPAAPRRRRADAGRRQACRHRSVRTGGGNRSQDDRRIRRAIGRRERSAGGERGDAARSRRPNRGERPSPTPLQPSARAPRRCRQGRGRRFDRRCRHGYCDPCVSTGPSRSPRPSFAAPTPYGSPSIDRRSRIWRRCSKRRARRSMGSSSARTRTRRCCGWRWMKLSIRS